MMKRLFVISGILSSLLLGWEVSPARAEATVIYTVQPGDTLLGIAAHHNVSPVDLASANGLEIDTWVYVGQQLVIPRSEPARPAPAGDVYTVQPGETLTSIALRHRLDPLYLAEFNGLAWNVWLYAGQQLVIPLKAGLHKAPRLPRGADNERWVEVDLAAQRLLAYEGSTVVFTATVSTGLPATPTPVGEFRIWVKLESDDMEGPGYYLSDVPYVMYFHYGYGLHGTYWHNNFGQPMSHGCVNLAIPDAEWLFNWTTVGTRVVAH
jgi:lipoprotein-anchoring transpeptidase ErfK/SrfK